MSEKKNVFQHFVFLIFRRFGLPKRIPNPDFFKRFRKLRFGENPYKTLAVRRKIKVRTLNKSPKNHFNNAIGKGIAKNLPKIDFYFHLELPEPPNISPKSDWDASKWGLEGS